MNGYDEINSELARFQLTPDEVLWEVVTRDGSCMEPYRLGDEPTWTGNKVADRGLAARICAGCPVRWQCLELELRTSGNQPLGVWGALSEDEIKALHPAWLARRAQAQDGGQQ